MYLAFNTPDLSKYLMYDFHYNHIKTKYDAKLLFTDTDKYKDLFDFVTIYKIETFFILPIKSFGKMKDDFKGNAISKFVGLNSKMYSFK